MTTRDYTWAAALAGVLPPANHQVAVLHQAQWVPRRLLSVHATGCYVAPLTDPVGTFLTIPTVLLVPTENLCWNLADPDTRAVFLSHLAIRHGAPREAVDQGVRFYFDPQGELDEPRWVLEAGVDLSFRLEPGGMARWDKVFCFEGDWTDHTPQRFWLAMALAWLEAGK